MTLTSKIHFQVVNQMSKNNTRSTPMITNGASLYRKKRNHLCQLVLSLNYNINAYAPNQPASE